jgi:hypothetical protein
MRNLAICAPLTEHCPKSGNFVWQSARRSTSTAQSLATLGWERDSAGHRFDNPGRRFSMRKIWQSARRSPSTTQNLATLGSERDSGWRVVWRPREEVFDLGSARNGIVSAR